MSADTERTSQRLALADLFPAEGDPTRPAHRAPGDWASPSAEALAAWRRRHQGNTRDSEPAHRAATDLKPVSL